ncbi:MAG TPA: sensor domain-containing diguanylate cyclase [Thermoanaerobaculia bacterium]|jgi:diguanylate cyclase (GGDEF)-like protein|nr:sensor domain-containing diguanylate cyclase [Thermoanaerobaculia bacterium]
MSDALSLVRDSSPREDLRVMDGFHCLDHVQLERFLERRRATPQFPLELSLAENLVEVLRRANGFVPSEAGSILLDNPSEKKDNRRQNTLTFIAAFGDKSEGLLGQTIPADRGIAGRVYLTGEAYVTPAAREDRFFYGGVDEQTRYRTESLIAIPIRIEQEVCGVLELINRVNSSSYSGEDRNLLEIFAGYISISIQNVLDGRQAQEIAKRDNLTGLYNDRYLHIALADTITHCQREGLDLAVLFLDLDFFKRVNDTHGHLAGSQVLREVGHVLRRKLAEVQGLAARYGGDEFVLLAPGADLERAVDVAEEIRAEILGTTFCAGPGEIQPDPLGLNGLTCSIGVATLRQHIMDELPLEERKSTLLRLADAAMYVAKETGRNRTAVAGQPVRRRASGPGPAPVR